MALRSLKKQNSGPKAPLPHSFYPGPASLPHLLRYRQTSR